MHTSTDGENSVRSGLVQARVKKIKEIVGGGRQGGGSFLNNISRNNLLTSDNKKLQRHGACWIYVIISRNLSWASSQVP